MNATLSCLFDKSMDRLTDSLRLAMLAAPLLFAAPQSLRAEDLSYVSTISIDEEVWDEPTAATPRLATGEYGPFRVKGDVVELVDAVDASTPAKFKALLAAHPGIKRIEMIECPGSEDDDANLEVARMIRAKGLDTHVPATGSIRSGGVELFLAGVNRSADEGAEVGVHSWEDSDGLQATDYPANDPVHRPYISFYTDMGMDAAKARAFYDFTNTAAPFDGLHVMSRAEMVKFGLIG
jgi:hypothetical protein